MVLKHILRITDNKMLRILAFLVLTVCVICCASGCGGEDYPEIKIDAVKMANAIIDNVDFESEMQQIARDSISNFIDMPEDLKEKYQYYTEAKMEKLRDFGYLNEFYSLEEGIEDYVKEYLLKGKIY